MKTSDISKVKVRLTNFVCEELGEDYLTKSITLDDFLTVACELIQEEFYRELEATGVINK